MPLLRDGEVIADRWFRLADDEPLPEGDAPEGDAPEGNAPEGDVPVIVGFARWQADRAALIASGREIGLAVGNADKVEEIGEDAARFGVIVLHFPKFTDGRAYSQARLLRERYGYRGELRASGNLLPDQLDFMRRCGFETFETDDPRLQAHWGKAVRSFSVRYQPAVGEDAAMTALRRHRRPEPDAAHPR